MFPDPYDPSEWSNRFGRANSRCVPAGLGADRSTDGKIDECPSCPNDGDLDLSPGVRRAFAYALGPQLTRF